MTECQRGHMADAEGAEGAVKEKELGTEAYNNKDFETALAHYQKASELDASAMVYRNNMAAAYFGMRKYQECIDTCKKAVEIGKENRADFKDLARAYARMGNALVKLDDLEGACQEFENSLMEHKDPQVALKAKNARHAITQKAAQNYLNPEQAEEHRQKGNAFFKEGKWVEAISEYSEGLKRDPENHLIYSNRGATYIKVAHTHARPDSIDDAPGAHGGEGGWGEGQRGAAARRSCRASFPAGPNAGG